MFPFENDLSLSLIDCNKQMKMYSRNKLYYNQKYALIEYVRFYFSYFNYNLLIESHTLRFSLFSYCSTWSDGRHVGNHFFFTHFLVFFLCADSECVSHSSAVHRLYPEMSTAKKGWVGKIACLIAISLITHLNSFIHINILYSIMMSSYV